MPNERSGRRDRRRGVTLVEVLVAATVLAVGVVALCGTLGAVARAARAAQAAGELSSAASSTADRLRLDACTGAATRAGVLDSSGVRARWDLSRVGDAVAIHVSMWRPPVVRVDDSASVAATAWCAT